MFDTHKKDPKMSLWCLWHVNSLFSRSRQSRQYKVLDLEDVKSEEAPRVMKRMCSDDMDMDFKRVSVDLMADPDIQHVFRRSFSLEDVTRLEESDDDELDDAEDALVSLVQTSYWKEIERVCYKFIKK